jgi:ribosomal protein S6--L-glutamate ligase
MKIAFILKRHPDGGTSTLVTDAARLLRERRHRVDLLYPEETLTELGALRPTYDLYVLKSRTDVTLSIAGALHAAGATILNPYPVSAACRDKVVASQLLRRAGVPLPEGYVAGSERELAPLLDDGPLVVKPYRGSQGHGVRVVRSPDELAPAASGHGPVFAQRYYEPLGRDRKIYRIGDGIFGVKRVWPARTLRDKLGEPFAVGDDLRKLALRLGTALGIDLYGFDVVLTERGPYVVDFSPFPGFKGVPEAASLLAEYIADRAAAPREAEPAVAHVPREPVPA